MAEPFILINTYAIKEGKLEDYKQYLREFFEFVKANEPRLLHFEAYINEDGTEVTNVQVHPDGDSMEFHLQVAGEKIARSAEFADFTRMSVQVCGTPGDALQEHMRQIAGSGVALTITTPFSGFTRLKAV